jgi:hypothetical protein
MYEHLNAFMTNITVIPSQIKTEPEPKPYTAPYIFIKTSKIEVLNKIDKNTKKR